MSSIATSASLGRAIDDITIGSDLATAIAHDLNATHRAARAARERAAEVYKAQLASLDEKESRLVEPCVVTYHFAALAQMRGEGGMASPTGIVPLGRYQTAPIFRYERRAA